MNIPPSRVSMSEYSGSFGEAVIQRSPSGYDESPDSLGVANQLNELGICDSEDEGSSYTEALHGSRIDRDCSDSQLSDTATEDTESSMDDSYPTMRKILTDMKRARTTKWKPWLWQGRWKEKLTHETHRNFTKDRTCAG